MPSKELTRTRATKSSVIENDQTRPDSQGPWIDLLLHKRYSSQALKPKPNPCKSEFMCLFWVLPGSASKAKAQQQSEMSEDRGDVLLQGHKP